MIRTSCVRFVSSVSLSLPVLLTALSCVPVQSVATTPLPQFTVHRIGFDGPFYTLPNGTPEGVRSNRIQREIGTGISGGAIVGDTTRYNPTARDTAGSDAWVFSRSDKSLRQLGLLTADYYEPPLPTHRTRVWRVNDAGQVTGTTSDNPRLSSGREHAWIFEPTTGETTRIGLSTLPAFSTIEDNPSFLMPDGFSVGTSDYNSSTRTHWAWSFDPSEGITRQIGLLESTLGLRFGEVSQSIDAVTPSNTIVGHSNTDNMQAVWVHRPGTDLSERIGLFGGLYTRNNGDESNSFVGVNDNGLVLGTVFFATPSGEKFGTWLYDINTGQNHEIGLANPIDGTQFSDGVAVLSNTNFVIGSSNNAGSIIPWVYNHTSRTTSTLGFTDARHTLTNGSTSGEVQAFSDSGYLLGVSRRTEGGVRSSFNTSAWIYNQSTGETTEAGLFRNGARDPSRGISVNNSGQALGISYRDANVGVRPWFYDPANGQTIALAPSLHSAGDSRITSVLALNENGQAVGVASNSNGRDVAWFYDHNTGSTRTGFGYRDQFTDVYFGINPGITLETLTDSGLVLAYSERRNIFGSWIGSTPWLYDSNTGTTHGLIFSSDPDGLAQTNVQYLSEDGVIYGDYLSFENSLDGTKRYFYWSLEHGFHDLEDLVIDEISELDWETLGNTRNLTDTNLLTADGELLLGFGTHIGGYQMPFALVPIPEPSSWVMISMICIALGVCIRKSHSS